MLVYTEDTFNFFDALSLVTRQITWFNDHIICIRGKAARGISFSVCNRQYEHSCSTNLLTDTKNHQLDNWDKIQKRGGKLMSHNSS